jgi:hypothetical protein
VFTIHVWQRRDDDQKSTIVGDIDRPNGHVGDEVIWPANVADEPINSESHRRRRAFSQPSSQRMENLRLLFV